jgi:signal transduction histidine kinase
MFIPDQKVMIEADGVMPVKVFENILSNAVHYGKSGRYIEIFLE